MGNRTLEEKQIFEWIRTRPGDTYHNDRIKNDLQAILETKYFDMRQTTFWAEEGIRGGVGVLFEVVEVPTINEISFEGLPIDSSRVLSTLSRQFAIRKGAPYQVDAIKEALTVIKQAIESQGKHVSSVSLRTEGLSATKINVTFVVTK